MTVPLSDTESVAVARPGWLIAAVALLILGAFRLFDALWAALVDHEWWHLPVVPVAAMIYGWGFAGCWRRAQGRPARTS
jgi:hypothetical protein